MLSGNAADFYRQAPWMILFPGVAISIAVFAFNLFGDSLRDYLDPRFKWSLALSSDIAGSRLRSKSAEVDLLGGAAGLRCCNKPRKGRRCVLRAWRERRTRPSKRRTVHDAAAAESQKFPE